jgi:hypothetical protein
MGSINASAGQLASLQLKILPCRMQTGQMHGARKSNLEEPQPK